MAELRHIGSEANTAHPHKELIDLRAWRVLVAEMSGRIPTLDELSFTASCSADEALSHLCCTRPIYAKARLTEIRESLLECARQV